MNTFVNAVKKVDNQTFTENGMPALKSSMNKNVDFFFAAGASRNKDVTGLFREALKEDRELALRQLLWVRDAREGAGERQTFRNLVQFLEMHDDSALIHVLPRVAELGRWDDLLVLKSTQWKHFAFQLIGQALQEQNQLCAKWMPRKGAVAKELREFFKLTPKQYRKGLVQLSNTVEQAMCAKNWENITFSHVPSVAASRYQKAFNRNCGQRYIDYKQALASGSEKINAKAIFPYDVLRGTDKTVVEAQWEALPNYIAPGSKIVPMIDTSASMTWFKVAGNLVPLDVAVSLGLYTATKQTGAFKDIVLSFSTDAQANVLSGNLQNKVNQIRSNPHLGGSTNIQSAFRTILDIAVKNKVNPEDMPTHIMIFSDMQFDQGIGKSLFYNKPTQETSQEMIERMYKDAGYKVPNVIYWNLDARGNNTPVEYKKDGTALVSGFSPSLMTSILGAKEVTPQSIMLETIMKPRYDLA